jgi:5-methylcytosine-specific restriction protein A
MPYAAPRHRPVTIKAKQHQNSQELDHRQGKRLYATNSRVWRAIRLEQLQHEPLCRECMKAKRVTAANEVDHVDGDSHNNKPSNLQSLCKPCHARLTALHDGGFGREINRRNNNI